jgi:Uma2 family endonuclease
MALLAMVRAVRILEGKLSGDSKPMATSRSQSWSDDADGRLPPLEPGDRLSRAEFERRYEAMPQLRKAELIEGVVHMPSSVRHRHHGRPHLHLATWLGVYEAGTPGVEASDNSTARLDLANVPQPDGLLFIDPARGGRARLSTDDYIEGSPELVAEVSASRVSIDLNTKLIVYQRNAVQEYIVWRVQDREIDWFVLRDSQYERILPDADGILHSTVFPGLWLDPAALVRGDLATVLAVLQRGLVSPKHAAFVERLNPSRAPE